MWLLYLSAPECHSLASTLCQITLFGDKTGKRQVILRYFLSPPELNDMLITLGEANNTSLGL